MTGKNGKKSSGGGLRVFWIPKKHHKKYKKETHHRGHSTATIGSQSGPASSAAGAAVMTRAMMSGDSPDTHCRTEPLLELKERPVACSSNGSGKLAGETVTASVLVEPLPKQQDAATALPPPEENIPKCSRSTSTDDETIESAATPLAKKKEPDEHENGPLDTMDGDPTKFIHINGKKQLTEDEEDDSCGIKCLYYTLQCCECTIM